VLREETLAIVFQPIVDLENGDLEGLEALARFHAEPLRSPDVWFADADLVGLREPLELRALELGCSQIDAMPSGSYLSLNLSPPTLTSESLAAVLDGARTHRILIEVTEHARVDDYASLLRRLHELRDAGVRFAIDDAGAGYSSLRHIVRLLPDVVKIDAAFTQGVDVDSTKKAAVTALLSFADSIGATVVAEGVETTSQLGALRELGVPFGQGYLLGRPAPLASHGVDGASSGRSEDAGAAGNVVPLARPHA
jgi:EAL domain-containing protein (putative c-di-GMP-specific phosphodiesterase class I)